MIQKSSLNRTWAGGYALFYTLTAEEMVELNKLYS